jgi:hypothetical protein
LLTDKPELIFNLIDNIPGGESRSITATPIWVGEADWKDALAFISEDVAAPRALAILDFDVALQDAYLVPALVAWVSGVKPECANRVVLVPSQPELGAVSPRVFELAALIAHNVAYVRDLKRIAASVTDSPLTLELPQLSSTILAYARSKNVTSEDELAQYAANYGVSVPTRVLENFVSVFEGLRASLKARDAAYVAQHATLIPWIEYARGEATSRTMQAALRTVFDAE